MTGAFLADRDGRIPSVQEGAYRIADPRWKVEPLQDTENIRASGVVTSFVNGVGEEHAYAEESAT